MSDLFVPSNFKERKRAQQKKKVSKKAGNLATFWKTCVFFFSLFSPSHLVCFSVNLIEIQHDMTCDKSLSVPCKEILITLIEYNNLFYGTERPVNFLVLS